MALVVLIKCAMDRTLRSTGDVIKALVNPFYGDVFLDTAI